MTVEIVQFASSGTRRCDWTNDELSELYRVEHALVQSRVPIHTTRGVTDEGDPWFVFCRPNGDVIVHITRYDGLYRLHSPALSHPLTGPNFTALTVSFVSGFRFPIPRNNSVTIHPAALLSVLVAAIFCSFEFHDSAQAKGAATDQSEAENQIVHSLPDSPIKDVLTQRLITGISAFFNRGADNSSVQQYLQVLADVHSAALTTLALSVALSSIDPRGTIERLEGYDDARAYPADDLTILIHRKGPWELFDKTILSPADGRLDDYSIDPANVNFALVNSKELPGIENVKLLSTLCDIQFCAGLIPISDKTAVSPCTALPLEWVFGGEAGSEIYPEQGDSVLDRLALSRALLASDRLTTASFASSSGDTDKFFLYGHGNLQIGGGGLSKTPELVFTPSSVEYVDLQFVGEALPLTLRFEGDNVISLVGAHPTSPLVPLIIHSDGPLPNRINIADTAISVESILLLTIMGSQDLTICESPFASDNTRFDATEFSGKLIFDDIQWFDLSAGSLQGVVINENNPIYLLNAANNSHVQLDTSVDLLSVTLSANPNDPPSSLSIDLSSGNSISRLDVFFTSQLIINSDAFNSTNFINTITGPNLTDLVLTGNSDFSIRSMGALTGINAPVMMTIDAHGLHGSLYLDVSNIFESGNRSIVIIGSSGHSGDVLTNHGSAPTHFILGDGPTTINVGTGVANEITGLKGNDLVNVGSAAVHADELVDGIHFSAAIQEAISGEANLIAGAEMAALVAASNVQHQAVLFSYQGGTYVFIDASGNHSYDLSNDAVIKLTGLAESYNLTGIFHSA